MAIITESHSRESKIKGSSDRTFGLVFAAFFAIIAILPLMHGGPLRSWALIPAGALLAVALVRPNSLSKLNRLWQRLGKLLNKIVSPVALGVVFYLSILPVGLFLRMLDKDPLRLKYDPSASSYWLSRIPPGPNPNTMNRQF